jgi:hypothetical protein
MPREKFLEPGYSPPTPVVDKRDEKRRSVNKNRKR